MGGRPMARADIKLLDAVGGEELVSEMILEGGTTRSISKRLGISTSSYHAWVRSEPGRRERLNEVRALRAELLDQEGLEIADGLASPDRVQPLTREEIAAAKLRVDQRRHMAAQLDPERRGNRTQVDVNLTVGALMLEALQAHGDARRKPEPLPAEIVGQEGLEEGEEG